MGVLECAAAALAALLFFGQAILAPARAASVDALLPSHPAYRENKACDPIEPPPFDHMPHNDGDYAICFSYGAADMISQRVGAPVSALDLATAYFYAEPQGRFTPATSMSRELLTHRTNIDVTADFNPAHVPYVDKLEGGEENFAILLANRRGLCRESDLPSQDGFRDYVGLLAWWRFRALAARGQKVCRKEFFGVPEPMRGDEADYLNAQWLKYSEGRCHRFKSPVPLIPVVYRLSHDLVTLLEQKARGWKPSPAQVRRVFGMIDFALEHHRYPAVGYSYEALEKRLPTEGERDIDHSSVIIGRRKIAGACHYLVQDDAGENCIKLYPKLHDRCVLGRIGRRGPNCWSRCTASCICVRTARCENSSFSAAAAYPPIRGSTRFELPADAASGSNTTPTSSAISTIGKKISTSSTNSIRAAARSSGASARMRRTGWRCPGRSGSAPN